MSLSIRASIILGTTAVTAAALTAAAFLIHAGTSGALLDQFDRSLEDRARSLASAVELKPEGIEVDFDGFDLGEFEPGPGASHLQIWSSSAGTLYQAGFPGAGVLTPFPGTSGAVEHRWVELPEGQKMRAAGLAFYPRIDPEEFGATDDEDASTAAVTPPAPPLVQLVVARQPLELNAVLERLRTLLLLVGALTALAALGLLSFVVWRGLRPLERLALGIAGVGDANLAGRLDIGRTPAEIGPVVAQLNALLARLDRAVERDRSLSADIAHELRTPIAGLRSTMEVALSRPRDAPAYREALRESSEILGQMQDMVEKLLYLARLESNHLEPERAPANLAELVDHAWQSVAPVARARRLDVRFDVPDSITVTTDEALLLPAIRNALENAATYADEGGTLDVAAAGNGSRVSLHITNSGCDVAPEEVDSLFDRFFRRDASRSATGRHFGLGLPIVKNVVSRLGHEVRVRAEKGGTFQLTFVFPDPAAERRA